MNNYLKILLLLVFTSFLSILLNENYLIFAADDVIAISKVKATFRKIVPDKINIDNINLYIPEMEVGVPITGMYTVQCDGGELKTDSDGNVSVSDTISVTIWLYLDVLEREPGIASTVYNNLLSQWDEKKGKLIKYSVKMPPYDAAYYVKSLNEKGKSSFEVNIISPAGDNFLIKMSIFVNKENWDKDLAVKLAKDLLDYLIRKAIDVEFESVEKSEENGK